MTETTMRRNNDKHNQPLGGGLKTRLALIRAILLSVRRASSISSKLLGLGLFGVCAQSWSASVIYTYDNKGNTNGILGVTGVIQESSWRCKGDDSASCSCPTVVFSGTIAKLDYQNGSPVTEGFVLETNSGAEYISLGKHWNSELGTADSSWVLKLLRKNEKVVVIAERCGVSGNNIVGRDIFSSRMFVFPVNRVKR